MSNLPPYTLQQMDDMRAKLAALLGPEAADLIESFILMIIEDREWVPPDDRISDK